MNSFWVEMSEETAGTVRLALEIYLTKRQHELDFDEFEAQRQRPDCRIGEAYRMWNLLEKGIDGVVDYHIRRNGE